MQAGVKQRLAESFETALRHADGRALAVEIGQRARNTCSRRKFACPVCNYALAELEPRLFSFNNPMGACPKCDGLGAVEFFDPRRVVAHPHLSLASGAIKGWDRRNQFYYLDAHLARARTSASTSRRPGRCWPKRRRQLILYGSGKEKIAFRYLTERGRSQVREHAFEGVLPNLERRYRETDSVVVREELAKFRNTQPCPDCDGTRLRREARHVKVADRTIFEVSRACRSGRPCEFFQVAEAGRAQSSRSPSASCARSPPASSSSSTSASTTSRSTARPTRSRAARRSASGSPRQIGSGLTGVMYVLDEPSIGLHQRDNARLHRHAQAPARPRQHA